jgi:hypothetical protein
MKSFILFFILFLYVSLISAFPHVRDVTVNQTTDGSGLVQICYTAVNYDDTLMSTNILGTNRDFTGYIPIITLLDTIRIYSEGENYGWRVRASESGVRHCVVWDMTTDMGDVENCGFTANIAVFDSVLSSYSVTDSFYANDSLTPEVRAFGLEYRRGELWVLYHSNLTNECWMRPYSLPDLREGDSIFVGTVTVGPSDMTFAGDRMFWLEDTRMILKEFSFETGVSHSVRSDWWGLPGTFANLAGAAFDGEKLWVCFARGTFIALDTSDFSLVDTMFFPEFAISTPATSADGLAWGLGILWCFSNDNIVYAIDTKTKTIIHSIPTGDVVLATGAEGAAWDGMNLWLLIFQDIMYISFHFSNRLFFIAQKAFVLIIDHQDQSGYILLYFHQRKIFSQVLPLTYSGI